MTNFEEGFFPGFEPKDKKDIINVNPQGVKKVEIKLTYASAEEKVHCQYCEDVGICDRCSRGIEESLRLRDKK